MKRYYHATQMKNLYSILERGILAGSDGVVYLAETKEDAYKFLAIRSFGGEDLLVIEVELDEATIVETFDHSYTFFQCRAFGYPGTVPSDKITDMWKFSRK